MMRFQSKLEHHKIRIAALQKNTFLLLTLHLIFDKILLSHKNYSLPIDNREWF